MTQEVGRIIRPLAELAGAAASCRWDAAETDETEGAAALSRVLAAEANPGGGDVCLDRGVAVGFGDLGVAAGEEDRAVGGVSAGSVGLAGVLQGIGFPPKFAPI